MINKIRCWGKSKIGDCYRFDITMVDEEIRLAKLCLSNLSKLENELNEIIEKNSIEAVLKFRHDFISYFYCDEILEKELYTRIDLHNGDSKKNSVRTCSLNLNVCKLVYRSKRSACLNLKHKIEDVIKKYNNDLAVVKKVQVHCLNQTEDNVLTDNNIYFKFSRDKYGELISLFFNSHRFIKRTDWEPVETVYVFSGNDEDPYIKHTVLHLKYEECSFLALYNTEEINKMYNFENEQIENEEVAQIHICDFTSYNKRRGHGTFILQHLDDIVKEVNKSIVCMTFLEREKYHTKPIRAINGEVFPGEDIAFDDLVKFYNMNGLPTINRTYSNGTCRVDEVIFKQLI